MLLKILLKNPLLVWVRSSIISFFYIFIYRKNKLIIGSGATIKSSKFGKYNLIGDNCTIIEAKIASYTYVASDTIISMANIGLFSSIGPECRIGLGLHPTKSYVSTHPIFFSKLKQCGITFADEQDYIERKLISIGHDVWIGARALVMDGVQIGTGAIVAAGAVVTKDVVPYSIVAGVPAKIIRSRFNQQQIDFIMESRWWEIDGNILKENYKIFHKYEIFKEFISTLSEINGKS